MDKKVMQAKDLQQTSVHQRVIKFLVQFFTYFFLIVMALIVMPPANEENDPFLVRE